MTLETNRPPRLFRLPPSGPFAAFSSRIHLSVSQLRSDRVTGQSRESMLLSDMDRKDCSSVLGWIMTRGGRN